MTSSSLRILADAVESSARRVWAFAFEERVPPVEMQLWNTGDNPTDYGIHKWTARSQDEVFARYDARGNPLVIDVEHNFGKALAAGEEPPVDEPLAGYARLELRAGAPWLVFEWSAYAVEQIATGQRRFLSPEYDVDRTTGEILAVHRVSLVANPGTHRARMLAAAINQETGMDPKLAAIMAILGSVSDPAAAIEAIKSLVANLDGGDAAAPAAGATEGEYAAGGDAPAGDAPPGDEKKDKVAAAEPPPADDKKDKVAAAAATVTPAAKPTAPATATATIVVDAKHINAAADAAVLQINNAQRDHLILTQGDRLDPSIRRWASAQSLEVVRGLINAAPAQQTPPGRVQATRGGTQGAAAAPGLQGKDLEELQKAMGTFRASAPEPGMSANGVLTLPSVPPSVHRERKRIAAAAAVTAGKDGK